MFGVLKTVERFSASPVSFLQRIVTTRSSRCLIKTFLIRPFDFDYKASAYFDSFFVKNKIKMHIPVMILYIHDQKKKL